jgi:hypothetical protein
MASAKETENKRWGWLTVDVWAVLLAVTLAVLVHFDVLKHIAW